MTETLRNDNVTIFAIMKDFYYQIKGKKSEHETGMFGGNWSFPPIFSGRVSAVDKKQAKSIIDDEYGRSFPLRVLAKDLDSNEFLLNIEEIAPESHIARLFDVRECKQCGTTYRVIDKYNDHNCQYKGFDYCSQSCKESAYKIEAFVRNAENVLSGRSTPIIYKITNKRTGKCYIGKTTQVFTLRWYQHFFHAGDNKFHTEIKTCDVTEWTFEVQEIVIIPDDIKQFSDAESFITSRERHWINFFDSINNGYNSI